MVILYVTKKTIGVRYIIKGKESKTGIADNTTRIVVVVSNGTLNTINICWRIDKTGWSNAVLINKESIDLLENNLITIYLLINF